MTCRSSAALAAFVVHLFSISSTALADDPPRSAPKASEGTPIEPAGVSPNNQTPRTSAPDRLVSVARRIELNSSAEGVEKATADLGKPGVSFDWCNRAGCVSHDSDVGSNRMHASWEQAEGDKIFRLNVMFCTEPLGSWQAAMVTVSASAKAPGPLGIRPKPDVIYKEMDVRTPGCMAK